MGCNYVVKLVKVFRKGLGGVLESWGESGARFQR